MLVIDALLCGAKGSNVWAGPWNDNALRTSRLYQSLIDTQLVTHVNSSLVPTRQPYLYKLSLTLPSPSHFRLSEETLDYELERIKDTQVSDADLWRAKNQLWTRSYLDQNSLDKLAHQLGYFESIASFTILDNFLNKIREVSKSDIQRVSRQVFKKKSRTVGWFVPDSSGDNVEVEDLSARRENFNSKKSSLENELLSLKYPEKLTPRKLKHHPQVAEWFFSDKGIQNNRTNVYAVLQTKNDKSLEPSSSIVGSWNSKRQALSNGVVVLASHNSAQNSFSLKLVVKAGASRDLDKQAGLANLTGRMVPSGSKNSFLPVHKMESLGLFLQIKTDYFSTTFELQGLSKHLPQAIELLALMVRNVNFSTEEFNKEREIILNELLQVNLNDKQMMEPMLRQNIFPRGHAFRRSIKGSIESIGTFLKSDLDSFYRKFYRPDQLILAISSDYRVDKIMSLIQNYFGDWKNNGLVEPMVVSSIRAGLKSAPQIISVKNKSLCKLVYGLPGVLKNEPDYFPLLLFSHILGNEARWGGRIRGQEDSISKGFVSLEAILREDLFMIQVDIVPGQIESASKFLKEKIEILKDQGFTQKELEFSKNALVSSLLIRLGSNAGITDSLIEAEWVGIKKNSLAMLIQLIRDISLEQLIDISRTRLFLDKASLVGVGSSCSSISTDLKVK